MRVGVFDSGIGGISVLIRLVRELKNAEFVYYGDNENAPYGNRSDRDIIKLSFFAANKLLSYNADAIVVACNTASTVAGSTLGKILPVPVFGICPPAERELSKSKTLLLCTEATAKRYRKYEGVNGFNVYPVKGLVEKIEGDPLSAEKIDVKPFLKGITERYETVILGCTHYYFVKIGIANHLRPNKITDGENELVKAIKYYPKLVKNEKSSSKNKVLFIGNEMDKNEHMFDKWFTE